MSKSKQQPTEAETIREQAIQNLQSIGIEFGPIEIDAEVKRLLAEPNEAPTTSAPEVDHEYIGIKNELFTARELMKQAHDDLIEVKGHIKAAQEQYQASVLRVSKAKLTAQTFLLNRRINKANS